MNSLELGQQAALHFANLKNIFHGSQLIDDGLSLKIECAHVVIGIQQVERYEKDISSYIGLKNEKTSFTFRDIAFSIIGDASIAIPKNNDQMSVRYQNDIEVEKFVKFCTTHKDALQEWPPKWFPKASEHSISELGKLFPGIAKTTYLEHQKIMSQWA